jgi:hypothetical protein
MSLSIKRRACFIKMAEQSSFVLATALGAHPLTRRADDLLG